MESSLRRPDHKTLTDATAEAILDAIQNQTYPPGSQLPPEPELMEILDVSRTTLRDALGRLAEHGWIIRKQGRGTFVREEPITKDLSINFGISEMISQAGLTPGAMDASFQLRDADVEIANALQLMEGDPVLVLDRVRTANQQKVVWSIDIASAALFGGVIPNDFNLDSMSIYDYIHDRLGYRITHGQAALRPILAMPEISQKLNVRINDPILLITQIDFCDDQPILYSIEYHLADRFVFYVQRKGPSW